MRDGYGGVFFDFSRVGGNFEILYRSYFLLSHKRALEYNSKTLFATAQQSFAIDSIIAYARILSSILIMDSGSVLLMIFVSPSIGTRSSSEIFCDSAVHYL